MNRRARSALFGLFVMASQIVQGGLAASVPCDDDSPGVLVPCLTEAPSGMAANGQTAAQQGHSPTCHSNDHCKYCVTGACHLTHVPALAMTIAPVDAVTEVVRDTDAPVVHVCQFSLDRILRPPR